MPTIDNTPKYNNRRFVRRDLLKPVDPFDSQKAPDKLERTSIKIENTLNSELQLLREARQIRTQLIEIAKRKVRHFAHHTERTLLKETINMNLRLCPTDCENIISVFEDTDDLNPSELRTLQTVKKIRELQDIRHQDNVRKSETQKRLAEVRNNARG